MLPAQTFMSNTQFLASCGVSGSAYQAEQVEQDYLPFPDEQCGTCGCFLEEEFSSGTESDDGAPIEQAQIYVSRTRGNTENDNDLSQAIYQDYAALKKLWRRVSNKPPRRYRRFNKFRKRHSGKFRPGQYAAFLPRSASAEHRGPGGPKQFSKFVKGRNPRGKDGKTMKCNICQSEEHLWRACPQGNGQPPMNTAHLAGTAVGGGSVPITGSAYSGGGPGLNLFAASQSAQAPTGGGYCSKEMPLSLQTSSAPFEQMLPGVSFYGMASGSASGSMAGSVLNSNMSHVAPSEAGSVTASPPAENKPEEWDGWKWAQSALSSAGMVTSQPPPAAPLPPAGPAPTKEVLDQQRSAESFKQELSLMVHDGGADKSPEPEPFRFSVHESVQSGITVNDELAWASWKPTGGKTELVQYDISTPRGKGEGKGDYKAKEMAMLASQSEMMRSLLGFRPSGSASSNQSSTPASIVSVSRWGQQSRCETCQCRLASDGTCKHCTGPPTFPSFPWWEAFSVGQKVVKNVTYHLRTRIQGIVGLLVDPGAHDNLVGDRTLAAMADQSGEQPVTRPLQQPMAVEGVGKASQTATEAGRVLVGVAGHMGSYTAPVIPNSDLPPLLGMRTLEGRKAILDIGSKKLIFPGPGGVHMQLSPGSLVFPLEKSPSGHLILPITSFPGGKRELPSDERLAFATSRPIA